MFSYTVSKVADKKAFLEVCNKIEQRFRVIKKEKPVVDVDGSQLQLFIVNNGKIKVYNDYAIDAVYVDSDIKLDEIIKAVI